MSAMLSDDGVIIGGRTFIFTTPWLRPSKRVRDFANT
jgi:hypothetical protein